MKRSIITMDESGYIIMPENVADIWMSEPELVRTVRGYSPDTSVQPSEPCIKAVSLKKYEMQKYVRLENGYHADVFSFPMIVALAFRINTFGAKQVRNAIFERMYLRKEKTNILLFAGQ